MRAIELLSEFTLAQILYLTKTMAHDIVKSSPGKNKYP